MAQPPPGCHALDGRPVRQAVAETSTAAMEVHALRIFVATRREAVPAECARFLSVDGSVPGAVTAWDHHVTGERINLEAMPDLVDASAYDGVGTTLADADAVASVVAVLRGGKARLPPAVRATLECASHWCDHLAPHPAHDAASNRLGRGLNDALGARFAAVPRERVSAAFEAVCRALEADIVAGRPLPFEDHEAEQHALAARLVAQGRLRLIGRVALVDLVGFPGVDPAACYALHDCPVAVAVDSHPVGGWKYTVGVNPRVADAPRDLGPALRALARAEHAHGSPARGPEPLPGQENWGGRATVFGSPWNYASRLDPDEVVATVARAMGWG